MKFVRIALILLSVLLTACNPFEKKESAEPEKQAATESQPDQKAAQLFSEALKQFQPTPEEAAFLDAAPAVNILGRTEGYYTNQAGVSGYFSGYEMPFNFIWEGGTKTITAIDGQTYQIMDGPGKILIKYMHDDLLVQRYQGDIAEGFWHGHGEGWLRNEEGEANSLHYIGEFQHDLMEGRGILADYDFSLDNDNPTEYRGAFKNNGQHGQGTLTDLLTGEVVYKGLWLFGENYSGAQSQWAEAEELFDLNFIISRQYSNLITVGPVEVGGSVNDPAGEGFLNIIIPEEAKNASVTMDGHPLNVGLIRHPYEKSEDGSDLYVAGITENIARQDYPRTFIISFEREGRREAVCLVVKRPFILELS